MGWTSRLPASLQPFKKFAQASSNSDDRFVGEGGARNKSIFFFNLSAPEQTVNFLPYQLSGETHIKRLRSWIARRLMFSDAFFLISNFALLMQRRESPSIFVWFLFFVFCKFASSTSSFSGSCARPPLEASSRRRDE